jgi:hypothetical protein
LVTNKTLASSTDVLGGVTTTLGSDATGDIYYRNSTGILTRLPIGGSGNILNVASGIPAWAAPTGGGNVSNTGTPVANQIAQWTNSTTVQGVNLASLLTAGAGIAITGTPNPTIAIDIPALTNSLTSSVTTPNGAFADGPSVAQGTTGTWKASGTVTLTAPAAANFICKMYDGTTTIAASGNNVAGGNNTTISLSGLLANPAGNIRIACDDLTAGTGSMAATIGGVSNASNITVTRQQ